MATGIEIWLGYEYTEYHAKAPPDAPRVPWPLPADGSEDGPREDWPAAFDRYADRAEVRNRLEAAWVAACGETGWKVLKQKEKRYWPVRVPGSARAYDFSPFCLDKQFGGEMGFDFPEVPIGVPLSGRYFPTFLDYKDSSGALPNPLVVWEPETARLIDVAARHITAAVPWLRDARTMVVLIHY